MLYIHDPPALLVQRSGKVEQCQSAQCYETNSNKWLYRLTLFLQRIKLKTLSK